MSFVASLLTALVALEHLFILYIEMFAWTTIGKRVFRDALPADLFPLTKGLAANQGLYNGFLTVGLCWTFFIDGALWGYRLRLFFLSCVLVAALYGGFRSSRSIWLKQGLPALLALLAVLLAGA